MNIKKRDETLVIFDINKIKNALLKAFENTNVENPSIDDIISHINNELINKNKNIYDIEEIQDVVEKTLMIFKYYDTAKHYINYRNEHNKNRNNTSYLSKIPNNIKTNWGMLGYVTYKRTYARRLNENDDNDETTEEFHDTIIRVLGGCQKQLKINFTNNELERAYKYMMELKFSVAGRFLWQLGTETIDKLGLMSLQNCAFINIDEPIKPFTWIFDVLMLGTGVGFNIQQENINKLPPVLDVDIVISRKDTKDADFIVPDSREGWVSLLEKMLEAYFYKGVSFNYSTILIRSAGTKIKGFGGVASGPEDLVKGLNLIQNILNNKKGQKLTSVDCLDIVNIIASVVVAGNVRRCLPKGAKVHTKEGLINIEDIIIGDDVLTSKGYTKVINKFIQGKQDVYVITTNKGEFRGTLNHKMLIYDENNDTYIWKTIGELKTGDKLINTKTKIDGNSKIELPSFIFSNRLNRINTPKFTSEIAWLFGYISGNFYINEKDTIHLKIKSHELLKKVIKILDSFGTSLRIITDIDINNNNYQIKIISKNFYDYINKYFINIIPYFINETTFNNRMSFIAGIFESNMCSMTENSIKIEKINSDTYKRDLSILLYSCGIENNTEHKKSIIIDDFTNLDYMNTIKFFTKTFPSNFKTFTCYKLNSMNVGIADIQDIKLYDFVDTYDIEVENIHEFFCDGFLTHNSALICMGDCDDTEYLNAKRWDRGNIPNWRCMSNNSVVCNDISNLPPEFWEGYNGNGEPYGLVNIGLSRKIGRVKDGLEKYNDPTVDGFNPCFTGETLIAVADGRGAVSIKELAEKGEDIPVYSVNKEGIVEIKMGRHPRITGINQKIVKIILDDDTYIKTTHNHKFRLNDGTMIEAKDLKPRMSLTRLQKSHNGDINNISVYTNTTNFQKDIYNENELIKNFKLNKLNTYFNNGILSVNKCCENCKKEFITPYIKREVGYCSIFCSNTSKTAIQKRTHRKNIIYEKKQKEIRHNQIMIYKDLQEILYRDPYKFEWENECKKRGIPYRLRTPHEKNVNQYVLHSYKELKSIAIDYNHRVKSIEFIENMEDVYNITVDDNHTIGIFTNFKNFEGSGIFTGNCGEITLSNAETCCLSEIFLPNIIDYEQLKDVATFAYRICKHSLLLKCHQKNTENIVHNNSRIGIGITGYLQSTQEQKNWLSALYDYLRDYDIEYSNKIGASKSIRLTTIKPSGTLSLLAGVTSGAHPAIYKYFIRRIRISSSNTSLINIARNHNYFIEYQRNFDGTDDKNTMIIEFPCCYPDGTVLAKDMTAIQQLETIKELQTNWSDNAVSVTIYYRLEELDEIKKWLNENYNDNIKSCSFLLHNEHGFKQAPYEEISKEKYEELIKKVIPITSGKINNMKDNELSSDCVGGSCPIR